MNAILLLVVLTTSTLVLRSGDRIDVEGPIKEKNGVVTFKSEGRLYSMPLEEIDVEASNKADEEIAAEEAAEKAAEEKIRKLRVSPEERKRLFEELAKNHNGTAAPRQQIVEKPAPLKSEEKVAAEKRDEWEWRREARSYEDAVTHAKEELALLESRLEELQSQINGFLSQGFKPEQFTYQTTQIERVRAQIPRAKLEVQRAQRELERFREDARKQGIMPGWLRD
jgi:chromosome segregation ATPase